MKKRDSILKEIVAERERQLVDVAGAEADIQRPATDWVGVLSIWLGKAGQETELYRGRSFSRTMFRSRLVQIAAICVAAIEALDERRETPSDGGADRT